MRRPFGHSTSQVQVFDEESGRDDGEDNVNHTHTINGQDGSAVSIDFHITEENFGEKIRGWNAAQDRFQISLRKKLKTLLPKWKYERRYLTEKHGNFVFHLSLLLFSVQLLLDCVHLSMLRWWFDNFDLSQPLILFSWKKARVYQICGFVLFLRMILTLIHLRFVESSVERCFVISTEIAWVAVFQRWSAVNVFTSMTVHLFYIIGLPIIEKEFKEPSIVYAEVPALLMIIIIALSFNILTEIQMRTQFMFEIFIERRMEENKKKREQVMKVMRMVFPQHIITKFGIGQKLVSFEDMVHYDFKPRVTVVQIDLVGFTNACSRHPASLIVRYLNDLYNAFDQLSAKYGITRAKTLGDAYIACSDIFSDDPMQAKAGIELALDIIEHPLLTINILGVSVTADTYLAKGKQERFTIRAGISTGTVVCGIIDVYRPCFSYGGSAVEGANTMESTSLPGIVQISQSTYDAIVDKNRYGYEPFQLEDGTDVYRIRSRREEAVWENRRKEENYEETNETKNDDLKMFDDRSALSWSGEFKDAEVEKAFTERVGAENFKKRQFTLASGYWQGISCAIFHQIRRPDLAIINWTTIGFGALIGTAAAILVRRNRISQRMARSAASFLAIAVNNTMSILDNHSLSNLELTLSLAWVTQYNFEDFQMMMATYIIFVVWAIVAQEYLHPQPFIVILMLQLSVSTVYAVFERRNQRIAFLQSRRDQYMATQLASEQIKLQKTIDGLLSKRITRRLLNGETFISEHFEDIGVLFFEWQFEIQPEWSKRVVCNIGDVPDDDYMPKLANFALKLVQYGQQLQESEELRSVSFKLRVGISAGPAVAGVIGQSSIRYDLWGDTINVASRMMTTGQPGTIHVTRDVYKRIKRSHQLTHRGQTYVKGKGDMDTYWLQGRLMVGSSSLILGDIEKLI
ncbi:hypothetical protein PROFUN_05451 [Planoprotostelium fungivorum]|uniref:adenylate cyclase n=1 Tax=Planoprotostelium fungivorum TaxID=1890364 RepID=A0A2P6NQU4_9EUKA|nr:hypothetical protein PROFUN_05451 [Planoprotostelium fungivorum]